VYDYAGWNLEGLLPGLFGEIYISVAVWYEGKSTATKGQRHPGTICRTYGVNKEEKKL
jgi:hypothetical protein